MAASESTSPVDRLWYKEAVIYELHVKAFLDSTGDGIGDFPGLIQKLDYLQELGVTCLWLLPFYPSPLRDDGYDIADYYGVHQHYGTIEHFRQFVEAAHARGLRVITELVVNHTSDRHPWFEAARHAPPDSAERAFYVWSDSDERFQGARIIFTDFEQSNWTWDRTAQAYYWHRFFSHQPDLNFDNPRVVQAVIDIMRFWLELGVDGFRLDAIPYLIEREGTNCENLVETHAILKQFRAALDAAHPGKMFLAEANQWPIDVLPYFGDSDECNMAFHFPLMPRLFMALRQEDRYPIIDIVRQTPEIPAECQWALFLRNHDELTLEMVTDSERDYMYREYAVDPQMRINLGIRRRLAPLLGNNRRAIELLNSLLFSFPGTPIIYYGDEIGMGDNVYLGDRNGVRTPMQWTGDRNSGFSQADFARLYSPVIMDPVYGYQAVNVEAQQRDASSLLNWMKRLIALRKRFKAFSHGTMEFVPSRNRKVLTYLRSYGDEQILCVANLSRFVQPVEMELSRFEGLVPQELFGQVVFPPIGELPYFLTLGPHAFYWFQLRPSREVSSTPTPPAVIEEISELPILRLHGPWSSLTQGPLRAELERRVLPRFLGQQAWFPSTSRSIETVSIRAAEQLMNTTEPTFLMLIEVFLTSQSPQFFFVPVRIAMGVGAHRVLHAVAPIALARVESALGEGVLYDAFDAAELPQMMLELVRDEQQWPLYRGRVHGHRTADFEQLVGPAPAEPPPAEPLDGRLSNTVIGLGSRAVLKCYRRLDAGANPELESLGQLQASQQFAAAPRLAGHIALDAIRGHSTTLAIVMERIAHQATTWERSLDVLGQYFESIPQADVQPEDGHAFGYAPWSLLGQTPPAEVAGRLSSVLDGARRLGQRTAEMHLALCAADDPAWRPEFSSAQQLADGARWLERLARSTFAFVGERRQDLPEPQRDLVQPIVDRGMQLVSRVSNAHRRQHDVALIRCHGDFHLGQVLWAENDFAIVDFEGDAAEPWEQRRRKQSPLRDVATMTVSFWYAALTALANATQNRAADAQRLRPWADAWAAWTSAALVDGYRAALAGRELIPADDRQQIELWRYFALEHLLVLMHRQTDRSPRWVWIPFVLWTSLQDTTP